MTVENGAVQAPLRSRRFWILVGVLALGIIVMFVGAWQSRYNVSNIDGISYMSIARQYAAGHGAEAINAYWSPMISWLMTPLIKLGLLPTFAFDLINAFFGAAGTLLGSWFIWTRTNRSFWWTALFLVVAITFYVSNLFILTPDILVVTWVILFVVALGWLDDRLDHTTVKQAIWAGALLGAICAFGYLIKLFLVPVFAVTIIAWLLIRILPRRGKPFWERSRTIVFSVVSTAVVVVLLSAPWAITLSAKYHMPTIGSSFAVNVSAKFEPTKAEAAANALKLYAPPNRYAVSFGEDRTEQVSGSGFQSKSSLASRASYYLSQRITAFPFYEIKLGSVAPFALVIMIAFALALLFRRIRAADVRVEGIVSLTFWVYFVGYALITSVASGGGNSRYYWPMLLLSTMLAALAGPSLRAAIAAPGRRLAPVAFALIVLLLPIGALWQLAAGRAAPFSSVPSTGSAAYLVRGGSEPAGQRFVDDHLSKIIPEHSRIVGSDYRQTLRYAYYLDAQVYGRADQGYNVSDPKFQAVLRENHIQYYLLYTPVGTSAIKLADLGSVVGTFTQQTTCADSKTALVEPCSISVIKLTN